MRNGLWVPGNGRPSGLGFAIYFGATCHACGHDIISHASFELASSAGETHAKMHGVDLLAHLDDPVRRKRAIEWRGRPIVDVWKEDGL